jgi:dolichyl-phosphate-mannose--protein O-mannosyl transferase
MSFREKRAWISLITYGVVFGGYFFALWQAWDASYAQGLSMGLMVGAVVALIIVAIVLNTIIALFHPKTANAPADERETMIDLKAERIASYTLSIGVICLIGALLMGWNAFLVANLLLASMVIAELVKALAQIAFFRAS